MWWCSDDHITPARFDSSPEEGDEEWYTFQQLAEHCHCVYVTMSVKSFNDHIFQFYSKNQDLNIFHVSISICIYI